MRELRTRSCFAKLWKVTNCFHFFSAPPLSRSTYDIISFVFVRTCICFAFLLMAKNRAFLGVFTFVKEKWKMVWRGSHQILCFPSFSGPCRLSGHIKRGLFRHMFLSDALFSFSSQQTKEKFGWYNFWCILLYCELSPSFEHENICLQRVGNPEISLPNGKLEFHYYMTSKNFAHQSEPQWVVLLSRRHEGSRSLPFLSTLWYLINV